MTSENERLLKNIKEEKTVNQISLDMNISNKKYSKELRTYLLMDIHFLDSIIIMEI